MLTNAKRTIKAQRGNQGAAFGPPPLLLAIQLAFNPSPPRRRYPDPHHLDRPPAGNNDLALRRCKPAADKTGEHPTAEAVTADELFAHAVRAAGKQR